MASIEKSTQRLRTLYSNAQREIVREMREATSFRRAQLEAIRGQVQATLTELEGRTREVLPEEIRKHYEDGSFRVVKAFRSQGIEVGGALSQLDNEAIKAMADDTFAYFGQGMQTAARETNRVLSLAKRERIRDILAQGTISAKTRREISTRIKAELADGITVLRDRGGKRWSMDAYAEMLTRTKMTEATNHGLMNRLIDEGADLVEVSRHEGACPLCTPWEGRILSIRGETSGYPTVEEAESEGLHHPHCLEGWNEVRTSEGALPVREIRNGTSVADGVGSLTKVIQNVITDYSGVIYTLFTSDFKVSGTPEHACLTQDGWTRFKHVREGDALIYDTSHIERILIKAGMLDTENFVPLIYEKLASLGVTDELAVVTSTINFDDKSPDCEVGYVSIDDFLKLEINTLQPFDDERFVLIGIPFQSLRKFLSGLLPHVMPVSVSSVVDEMLLAAASRNAELIHRVVNTGGTFIPEHISDLISTHAFFVVDPAQKGFDWLTSLFFHYFQNGFHVCNVTDQLRTCKVYDIETESGKYLLKSGAISHNCRHRFLPYKKEIAEFK